MAMTAPLLKLQAARYRHSLIYTLLGRCFDWIPDPAGQIRRSCPQSDQFREELDPNRFSASTSSITSSNQVSYGGGYKSAVPCVGTDLHTRPRGDPTCRHTQLHEPFLSRKYSGGTRPRFGLLHRGISIVRRRVPDPNCRDCLGVEIPSALQ